MICNSATLMVKERTKKKGHGKLGKRRDQIEVAREDQFASYVGKSAVLVASLLLMYWHYHRVLSPGPFSTKLRGISDSLTLERCGNKGSISLYSSTTSLTRSNVFQ